MHKAKIYSSFLKADIYFDIPISIYVDSKINESDTNTKIAILVEPKTILSSQHKYILDNWDRFKYILSYDDDILKLPNAKLFEFGTPWILHRGYEYPKKEFSISTIISNKLMAPGHYLRYELWKRQNEIKNRKFFKSFYGNHDGFDDVPVLGQSKYPLFDSQYSIIIENTKMDYYFTEKITDCLICKTIPIYWGANKISNYFDGIIQVNTVDEIIDICNKLTPDDYHKSSDLIESNFKKAINYEDYNKRISEKIKEII